MDIIDVYIVFHPKAAEYTLFSNTHATFSRIHHMLSHKVSLSKVKKTDIISTILSDHKVMILLICCWILFPNVLLKIFVSLFISDVCVFVSVCSVMSNYLQPHALQPARPFSKQEYQSSLPFPTAGDLPDPRIESASLVFPALEGRFFTTAPLGKLSSMILLYIFIFYQNCDCLQMT